MTSRKTRLASACAALAAVTGPSLAQEVEVDLELVLAVDVSRSMDAAEQKLQKDGYVAALQHPEVLAAIGAGLLGRIAVTYMEWGGPGAQVVVAPWTLVDGAEAATAFAARIAAAEVSSLRATSISGALAYSASLFETSPFRSSRQVIDVSGDGPNNSGFPVLQVREEVLARGITINGLPIVIHEDFFGGYSIRELDVYYEECVIGGPGAFLVTVESFERIAEAIRRKLVLEIAGAPAQIVPMQLGERRPRIDCLIGEKLRRRWMDP